MKHLLIATIGAAIALGQESTSGIVICKPDAPLGECGVTRGPFAVNTPAAKDDKRTEREAASLRAIVEHKLCARYDKFNDVWTILHGEAFSAIAADEDLVAAVERAVVVINKKKVKR